MASYKAKTTENSSSVAAFLKSATDGDRLKDAMAIRKLMEEESGFKAKMWGPAIVGFGSYHYKYESGHEGDAPCVGFSPRKSEFAIYLSTDFEKRDELLKKLGKHKMSKACLYIKKLEDIVHSVFKEMIRRSVKQTKSKYP